MNLHIAEGHLLVEVLLCLFLIILACGSGYWMARFLPVRFVGEKVFINLFIGSLVALATFGLEKVMQNQVQREQVLLPIGWFLLQGIVGEITVQVASRRRRAKP